MTTQISKEDAQALLDNIRDGLINVEKNLVELVKVRGWEALGYETFSDMWKAELDGLPLARAMSQAHVCWALFAEKMPDEDIQELLGGKIGDKKLKYLREQHDVGVPAELASTTPPRQNSVPKPGESVVREHIRGPKSAPATLHVPGFTNDDLKKFTEISLELGKSRDELAAKMIKDGFAALEQSLALTKEDVA